jgi:hypothetical protein
MSSGGYSSSCVLLKYLIQQVFNMRAVPVMLAQNIIINLLIQYFTNEQIFIL